MGYNSLCDEIKVYKTETLDQIDKTDYFNFGDRDLNIIHLNVRSLSKNFENLLIYLVSLNKSFDVIALSETNDITFKSQNLNIPGYQLCYNLSIVNKCDGFVFYVKSSILKSVNVIEVNNCKFLRVKLYKNDCSVGLTGYYRCHDINQVNFISSLEQYYQNLQNKCETEIFCGDVNVDILNLRKENLNISTNICNYLNIFSAGGFESKINNITRIEDASKTCIDHFFIKSNKTSHAVILQGSHSDHFPILLNIVLKSSTHNNKTYYKKLNKTRLNALLKNETWEGVLKEIDSNTSGNQFINILNKYISLSTEVKYIKCKHRRKKPWITLGLITSVRRRDKLKKLSVMQPNNLEAKNNYVEYRKMLTKLLGKAKAMYFKSLFDKNFKDAKETWKTIKQATNEVAGTPTIANVVRGDGTVVSDEREIAEEFNEYFSMVGETLAAEIIKPINNNRDNLNTNCNKSIFLHPITQQEVQTVIQSLKNSESNIGDGISNNVLKSFSNYLTQPLQHLINIIFSTGIFPDILKNSIIIPFHKTGSADLPRNYRPIALINNVSKVVEGCIRARLVDFLTVNDLLAANQYGFRRGFSTEDALVRVTDRIVNSFNTRKKCLSIFLDLAKAFDTVSHHILLDRLEEKGIRGLPKQLFQSYLENRSQQVKIGETLSGPRPVRCGVPQGTVLGPILFTIYIDGIFSVLPRDSVICYADDTAVTISRDTWKEVTVEAEKIMSTAKIWFDRSLLSLNIEKSHFICYSMTRAGMADVDAIKVHDSDCKSYSNCNCQLKITSVEKVKYLGVYFDRHLKWDFHVDYVCNKIRKLMYKFCILRQSLSQKSIMNIYKALVESTINYGVCIWGAAYDTILNALELTQKKILKIALFKNKRFPTETLFQEAQVLNVSKLYIKSVIRLFCNNKIAKNTLEHSINTRYNEKLSISTTRVRFTSVQKNLLFTAPRIYNAMPRSFKNKPFSKIKKQVTIWLLQLGEDLFVTLV